MDEIFSQIGEFGPAQKKAYFFICLVDAYASLHILTLSFIATNPEWQCLRSRPPEDGGDTLHETADPASRCWHYERGECTPAYSNGYTSIVAEVRRRSVPPVNQLHLRVPTVLDKLSSGALFLLLSVVGPCLWEVFSPELVPMWILHWTSCRCMDIWHCGRQDWQEKSAISDNARCLFVRPWLHSGTRGLFLCPPESDPWNIRLWSYSFLLYLTCGDCWNFSTELRWTTRRCLLLCWVCLAGSLCLFHS